MRYKKEEIKLYKRTLPSGLSVYYYRVYTPEGKRLRISTGQSKKILAKNYVNKLIEEGNLIPQEKKETLFSDFSKDFWDWDKSPYVRLKRELGSGLSKEYVKIQKMNLDKHILPFFGKMEIHKILRSDVEAWLLTFKDKGLSNQTAKHNLKTLGVIFHEAQKKGLITKQPTKDLNKIVIKPFKRELLTISEIQTLFNPLNIEKLWSNDIICYTANLLASLTGLRQGEVLALRGKNIFSDYIRVENSYSKVEGLKSTKTKSNREVPMSNYLKVMLDRLIKDSPEDYVFSYKGDKPVSPRSLTLKLYKALNGMGISTEEIKRRGINFHHWRHFFNTYLKNKGLDNAQIQKVTGHSSDEMTKRYLHPSEEEKKQIISIQDDILN
jgi:integrase